MKTFPRFVQSAVVWTHQKRMIPVDGRLGPKDAETLAKAIMLAAGK